MSEVVMTGQDAPAVDGKATPPAPATAPAETPAEGTAPPAEEKEPVAPKTYSEEEVQERIERATAKAAAKAERRAFREASQMMQRQAPVQQQVDDKPRRDQFASDEDYVDRLTDWKLDQRDKSANQQRQAAQATATNTKTENLYKEAEKLPGFDRDVFEELPLTPAIAQALIESDAPAKLMEYMTANPQDVDRIAALSPARQAAEIGKLEAKLASTPSVKTTKTPAPINPVGGGTGASGATIQNAKTMDEFMAAMKKNGSRWVR